MKQRQKPPLPLLQVGVGTFISSMTVAGLILGYVVDYYIGTLPLFLLVFGFLGMLGGLIKAYKFLSLPDQHDKDEAGKRSRDAHASADDDPDRNRFDRRRGF